MTGILKAGRLGSALACAALFGLGGAGPWDPFGETPGPCSGDGPLDGIDLEKEYALIREKRSRLPASLRKEVEHLVHQRIKHRRNTVLQAPSHEVCGACGSENPGVQTLLFDCKACGSPYEVACNACDHHDEGHYEICAGCFKGSCFVEYVPFVPVAQECAMGEGVDRREDAT